MSISRVRIAHAGANVVELRPAAHERRDRLQQGFGELLTATLATPARGELAAATPQTIFTLTQNVPYNFGAVTQLLNEVYAYDTFNTGSVRNIYSPNVCTATELMVDQAAKAMGKDPLQVPPRVRARRPHAGGARQGRRRRGTGAARCRRARRRAIAIHNEYKGRAACLVEIDCRPATVNRKVKDGYTGPRVTKVVFAVDVGLPINPLGLEAQMMGGIMDGIAQALTYSLHLEDGHFLEGSWDNAYYTRQWNVPARRRGDRDAADDRASPAARASSASPPSMAAVACAYARATGTMPTSFPINHNQPLGFTPYPDRPAAARSRPTDGLRRTYVKEHRDATSTRSSSTASRSRVDCEDDVRLLWVLRDLLGVTGPKYGCGLDVCKACTSHINGKAFNPCSVSVSNIKPTDEIMTIEGLPATVGKDLHPMQQAWLDFDVAQCGYCQPGQIMEAVALVNDARSAGRTITDDDLDQIRNVCRCGTYPRIREAITSAAGSM